MVSVPFGQSEAIGRADRIDVNSKHVTNAKGEAGLKEVRKHKEDEHTM